MSGLEREAMLYWTAAKHLRLTGCRDAADELLAVAMYTANPVIGRDCARLVGNAADSARIVALTVLGVPTYA